MNAFVTMFAAALIGQVEQPEMLKAPKSIPKVYLEGGVWHQHIFFFKDEVIDIAAHSAGAHDAHFQVW